MPKYLLESNYIGEGISGLLAEGGSGRIEALHQLVDSLGGTVEAAYYAFGETDMYIIVDMPDQASIAALALNASATGKVAVKTTVLLTPEELDAASQMSPDYRPPGE